MNLATSPKKSLVSIVSPFFHPENISTGKYNTQLAVALVASGASVNVVCSHPLYPDWTPRQSSENLLGTTIHRGGAWLRYPSHPLLRRAVLEAWFTLHTAMHALRSLRASDVVVPVFPPSLFWVVIHAALPRKTRTVGIVHDLQGVYAERSKGRLSKLIQGVITLVESKAFRECNHLIFLSRTMRDITIEKYKIDAEKTSVHYPFVSLEKSSDGAGDPYIEGITGSSLKSLVYSGALGEKQAPRQIVEFMIAALEKYPDWQARIFSQGPIFEDLKRTYSHQRLRFLPLVEANLLPSLLRMSDIQIVPQAPNTSDGSLPSKVPNIIASGTRLLCFTDQGSELAELINEYSAGEVCTSWNISECLKAFDRLRMKERASPEDTTELLRAFTIEGIVTRIVEHTTG